MGFRSLERLLALAAGMALCAPAVSLPAEQATRCPEGSQAARTVDPQEPWACVLADWRKDGGDCPEGTHSVTTTDLFGTFRCALSHIELRPPKGFCPTGQVPVPSSDEDSDYECAPASSERDQARAPWMPSCPRFTRPVPTPGALKPYRCEPEEPGSVLKPDHNGRCPGGSRRVRSEDPFEPVFCVSARLLEAKPLRYTRYEAAGRMRFQYPRGWTLIDAWKEEIPSLYIRWEGPWGGKPPSLSVSWYRRGRGSEPMESMIAKEEAWRGAKRTQGLRIAGLRSVHLTVPGETAMAFVDAPDGHFVLTYSAPAELFARFLPAYRRLLESFRLAGSEDVRGAP